MCEEEKRIRRSIEIGQVDFNSSDILALLEELNSIRSQMNECKAAFVEHIIAVRDARKFCANSALWPEYDLESKILDSEDKLWNLIRIGSLR